MVVKLYLYNESGEKINASFKWVRGLFTPTKVEIVSRSSDFDMGDVIYLKDESGNVLFKGKIVEKEEKERGIGKFVAMSEFHRLIEDYRAVTFFNKTNFDIVRELVDLYNYRDLTVVGYDGSRVEDGDKKVVSYFAQRGYTLSEIYYLLQMSGYYFTDYYEDGVWYLRPIKLNNIGETYKEGVNGSVILSVKDLKCDKGNVINKVIVKGKDVLKSAEESGIISEGSGEYEGYGYIKANHKIHGDLKLKIDGEEYNNAIVLSERGIILVSSSFVGKSYQIEYTWNDTPYVLVKDDNSIRNYGERMKVYSIETIDYDALHDYGNTIINIYKEPPLRAIIEAKGVEWEVGDKFSLKLYDVVSKSYKEPIDVIVYEKIYSAGRYYYRIGNVGTIIGIMKNILEGLKIDLNTADIGTTNSLTDNVLDVEVDWKGNLIGMEVGKGARLYRNFQDGNTNVSRRFGKIDIVLGKSYLFDGIDENYIVYKRTGGVFKINKNSSEDNVDANLVVGERYGRYNVDLHYVDDGYGIHIWDCNNGVCSKFVVDNLWTVFGLGIKYMIVYRDSLDLENNGDTQDMVSVQIGSGSAQYLFYAKKEDDEVNVYLKQTSTSSEYKLYTVSDYDENELRFILYFLSNEVAGGSGGKVRIYVKDSSSMLRFFEDDISVSENGANGTIYYFSFESCKGNIGIAFFPFTYNINDALDSNIYDVLIFREVIS